MTLSPQPISVQKPLDRKCKMFLVSYAADHSSQNLNPSITGDSWAEVGVFTLPSAEILRTGLKPMTLVTSADPIMVC